MPSRCACCHGTRCLLFGGPIGVQHLHRVQLLELHTNDAMNSFIYMTAISQQQGSLMCFGGLGATAVAGVMATLAPHTVSGLCGGSSECECNVCMSHNSTPPAFS